MTLLQRNKCDKTEAALPTDTEKKLAVTIREKDGERAEQWRGLRVQTASYKIKTSQESNGQYREYSHYFILTFGV